MQINKFFFLIFNYAGLLLRISIHYELLNNSFTKIDDFDLSSSSFAFTEEPSGKDSSVSGSEYHAPKHLDVSYSEGELMSSKDAAPYSSVAASHEVSELSEGEVPLSKYPRTNQVFNIQDRSEGEVSGVFSGESSRLSEELASGVHELNAFDNIGRIGGMRRDDPLKLSQESFGVRSSLKGGFKEFDLLHLRPEKKIDLEFNGDDM